MQTFEHCAAARHPAANASPCADLAGAANRRRGRLGRWLAGIALALAAGLITPATAWAGTAPPTVYCVATVAQLQAALAAIESTQGSFDLRIRSGYYPLTPPTGGVLNYGLRLEKIFRPNQGQVGFNRISGTWNEGCQQRAAVIDGSTTTLIDGQGQTGNLLVRSSSLIGGAQPTDIRELVIERIQFANGNVGTAGSSCVRVDSQGSIFYRINATFDRLRVELCEGAAISTFGAVTPTVTVRNSVFLGNSAQFHPGMSISADDSEGLASVYNNTFRFNRMGGQSSSTIRVAGANIRVFNNLFADTDYGGANVPKDVITVDGAATVRNNRLGANAAHLGTGSQIALSNTQVSPGFANASSPQLAATSPLRDLGFSPAPFPGLGDFDFTGNPRVQGAAAEIGAYELAPLALPDPIFANGFETP